MSALQKTLAIVAFLFLATQAVRSAYLIWLKPWPSVLDRYGRPTKNEIAQATSLDVLTTRYDSAHKEAESKRQEQLKAGREWVPAQVESEPFKSENEFERAIQEWESKITEIRELRFYWFAGLGFLAVGSLVYAKWNRWLGLVLSIIAFTEFIYWTNPDSNAFSWITTVQTTRLQANKLAFSVVSIVLLLIVIHLQGIFNSKVEA